LPQAVPWQQLFERCTLVGGTCDVVVVLRRLPTTVDLFFDRSNAAETDYIIITYPVHLICHLLTRPKGHRPRSIERGVRFKTVDTSRSHLRVITQLFHEACLHVTWAACVRSIQLCGSFVDCGLVHRIAGSGLTAAVPIQRFLDGECRPRPPPIAGTRWFCHVTAKWYRCTTAAYSPVARVPLFLVTRVSHFAGAAAGHTWRRSHRPRGLTAWNACGRLMAGPACSRVLGCPRRWPTKSGSSRSPTAVNWQDCRLGARAQLGKVRVAALDVAHFSWDHWKRVAGSLNSWTGMSRPPVPRRF